MTGAVATRASVRPDTDDARLTDRSPELPRLQPLTEDWDAGRLGASPDSDHLPWSRRPESSCRYLTDWSAARL